MNRPAGRSLRSTVKRFVPRPLLSLRTAFITRWRDRNYRGKDPREIFSSIYSESRWGNEGQDFYSGTGSHDPEIVSPYVAAVSRFIKGLDGPVDAVDLGCGDFNVGSQLRPLFRRYVACDVVPQLIERNRERFSDAAVEFSVVDMSDDPLPDGDVVMIRQVLQHLSNDRISRIVPKLEKYRYAIITEHLPKQSGFPPNLDKPTGEGTRLYRGIDSGVVLTAAPFNLSPLKEEVICTAEEGDAVIKTVAYTLR